MMNPTIHAAPAGARPPYRVGTNFVPVCRPNDILPDTGVCARVGGQHVAVFRVGQKAFYAIDNIDPRSGASVISRGLVGNLGEDLVVATPLYKQHINLLTGACLEDPAWSVRTYPVRIENNTVQIAPR